MGIFDKRPLSLILAVMLSGFVFFTLASDSNKIVIPTVAAVLFFISFFLKNTEKSTTLLIKICAIALLFASLASYLYFNLFFSVHERYDDEIELIATVDKIETDEYTREITLLAETIDGNDESNIKLLAFSDFSKSANVSEGAKVKILGTLKDFENTDSFNASQYYKSRQISAEITNFSSIELLEINDFPSNGFEEYRSKLSSRIILNSGTEAGGLLSALLLGDKTYLPAQTALDFQRLGISHILALSGMHLAILTFALERILSLLKIHKKWRKGINIFFVLGYMALTGFPVSVIRAGFMLIISSLLFLFARKSDAVTSLLIATTAICVIDPCSVYDISLWLSVLSTLGIVMLTEREEKTFEYEEKPSLPKRFAKFVSHSLISSVFAIGATMLLTTSNFKTLSLLGIFMTPIFSALATLLMHVGILLLIIADFIPICFIVNLIGESIIKLAGFFSSFDGIFFSADFEIVKILVFVFTVLMFGFFILKINHKKRAIALLSAFFVFTCSVCVIESNIATSEEEFCYSDGKSGEILFANTDSESIIIDVTNGNVASAFKSIEKIESQKITALDKYVFTSYSSSLPSAIETLLKNLLVREIYLPKPSDNEETAIYLDTLSLLESYRTRLMTYGETAESCIISERLTFFPMYSSSEDKVAFTVKYNDDFYTYISSGMMEGETKTVALSLIADCNTLIFGSHGPSYSNYEFIHEIDGIDRMIISSENFSIPSEVIAFYTSKGDCEIIKSPEHISFIR